MSKPCNYNLVRVLEAARGLETLARQGESEMLDDGCAVLYGTVRDCAFKIVRLAEGEIARHAARGIWDVDADPVVPRGAGTARQAGGMAF